MCIRIIIHTYSSPKSIAIFSLILFMSLGFYSSYIRSYIIVRDGKIPAICTVPNLVAEIYNTIIIDRSIQAFLCCMYIAKSARGSPH